MSYVEPNSTLAVPPSSPSGRKMHQGHNIPWNLIASHFTFKEDDKRFTPPFTGLLSKNKPNATQELKHFVKKFVQAIRTFSETERAKYPKKIKPRFTGVLFSDDLRQKHPEYLNEKNQRIEYWIQRARYTNGDNTDIKTDYNTGHGDLADVVKVLLFENEMETLLMLAQHPDIPLGKLHHLSWGHHFGFSRVKEEAVRSYLFFNSADATGSLIGGKYAKAQTYASLLGEIGISMDYPAQQIPHRQFLRACGALCGPRDEFISKKQTGASGVWGEWAREVFVHEDYALLQEYMKTLFAMMYRYDVLVQECGIDPEWEREVAYCHPLCNIVKIEYKWLEEDDKWITFLSD